MSKGIFRGTLISVGFEVISLDGPPRKRQMTRANKKEVKNKELWISLEKECDRHQIEWKWIKGHSGHILNERADELANQGIDELYK